MGDHVLTLNAGSSSIKFALFVVDGEWPMQIAHGEAEGLGASPRFHAQCVGGERRDEALDAADHVGATEAIVAWINEAFPHAAIAAVGHRIVHGGARFLAPALIDDAVLAYLRTLIPLAPLHQPHNLGGVEAAQAAFPGVPQVACFDTAFHRGHTFVNDAYALPRDYYRRGLRRFGFHGLSYEFIAHRLREIDPTAACGRVVVAHLGNGASLCAMQDGRSVATTMGFSALEGLPMGTRCGAIDPGLLLYLLEHEKMSVAALTRLLYSESGLLGLSELSQDMRALEASDSPQAKEAIAYFAHRVKMEIAALAATMNGLDALVFTGGIGEHSARLRAATLDGLGWLGVSLNAEANARGDARISDFTSHVPVYVSPTDEEAMIARHAMEATGLARVAA
ncbi:acetate/propionate family kinase [Methylocystis sp. 9N]|uniref:Acetate kinase n=1 Tax=Methylocystis borbori TaxID=3118750 RepID=A0ABU7XFA4_9HYPH